MSFERRAWVYQEQGSRFEGANRPVLAVDHKHRIDRTNHVRGTLKGRDSFGCGALRLERHKVPLHDLACALPVKGPRCLDSLEFLEVGREAVLNIVGQILKRLECTLRRHAEDEIAQALNRLVLRDRGAVGRPEFGQHPGRSLVR